MKRFICGLLTTLLLLAMTGAGSAESPFSFLFNLANEAPAPTPEPTRTGEADAGASEEAQGQTALSFFSQFLGDDKAMPSDPSPAEYALGTDVLASIPAVVGDRECVLSERGDTTQAYGYRSATVRDDLVSYINYLGEQGFTVVRGAPLGEPGEGELAAASKDAGQSLRVLLDWTLDSYRIRVIKSSGTGQPVEVAPSGAEADPALVEQGESLLAQGDYEGALAVFDAAIAGRPDVAAYHVGRGQALMDLDRFQEGLDAMDIAVQLDADSWNSYSERGVVYYYMGELDKALADFHKAVELEPTEDVAYFNLAYVQVEVGALEDAVRTCMDGLMSFPESPMIWQVLGDAQYDRGAYADALANYDNAIQYGLDPEEIVYYAEAKQRAEAPIVAAAPSIASLPAEDASQLKNYEDWIRPYVDVMPFQPSILDRFIHSVDYDNGLTEEAIAYPRAWPSQWLDGAIPAYTGTGWMFDIFVAHPKMSYAAKDLQHVAVTVYGYLPEEIEAYIAALKASGFEEVQDDRYSAAWMESVRSFRGRDCTLNIVFAHGEGPEFRISVGDEDPEAPLPFVQFNVDFIRDGYAPDLRITGDTGLLNYNQMGDLSGAPADRRSEVDVVTDSQVDEYGRLYETIYYPSQWPKDVFGELIPEYRHFGMMYYMVVTTPADNPSRDQTLIASMYIAAHSMEDVEQYARELAAFGYREVPKEEYTEQEVMAGADHDAYHIFALPSMRCIVAAFNDNGVDLLQITLRLDGRYQNFFNRQ